MDTNGSVSEEAIEAFLRKIRREGRSEKDLGAFIKKAKVDLLNMGVQPGQSPSFTAGAGGEPGSGTPPPGSPQQLLSL